MTKCFSLIRGRAARITRVDECGNVIFGEASSVTTKGFISVALTVNTEEGEAISVASASGDICVSDTPAPKFAGYGVEISLCGVDPELVHLLTGQEIVLDGTGESTGFRIAAETVAALFALELWSSAPAASCADGGASYGYLLLPLLRGGMLGDFTVENGAINFTITGATSQDGSNWSVGPYNVVLDGDGLPSPLLDPIDPEDHLHVQITQVAPPEPGCGAVALAGGFGQGGFGLTPFGGA